MSFGIMSLGPHAAFIVSAYAMAAAIVGALIAWVIADHHRQRRILVELESKGVTRRSGQAGE